MAIGDKKNVVMEADVGKLVPPFAHASQHKVSGSDPLTAADVGALPRDGSAAMTGDLQVNRNNGSTAKLFPYGSRTWIRNYVDDKNYQDVKFGDNQLAYAGKKANVDFAYNILHTGNKPSDSFTGNGSAAARTIETGAIGSVLHIVGNGHSGLVMASGAIFMKWDGSAPFAVPSSECRYSSGILTLSTTNVALNASQKNYSYQCL